MTADRPIPGRATPAQLQAAALRSILAMPGPTTPTPAGKWPCEHWCSTVTGSQSGPCDCGMAEVRGMATEVERLRASLSDATAALRTGRESLDSAPMADAIESAVRTGLGPADDTVLVCTRTWDAWAVGTMTSADFHNACEDDEVVANVVEAVVRAASPMAARLSAEVDRLRGEQRRRDDLIGHLWMALDRAERSVRDLADAHRPEKCAPSEIERLRALLGEVLSANLWHERGHLGEPCRRTEWIPDRTLADWRKRAGL